MPKVLNPFIYYLFLVGSFICIISQGFSSNISEDVSDELQSSNSLSSHFPPTIHPNAIIQYSSLLTSSESEEENDKSLKNDPQIYHLRESDWHTGNFHWLGNDGKIKRSLAYGPKYREGGLGPPRSIEISPWVKSVAWLENLKEGQELEFIFDPDMRSVYIGVNPAIVIGHCNLSDIATTANPYGGNIKKQGQSFRTDELSGHFGAKWHDKIRFKFIELMRLRGLTVLHEPWVRDSTVLKKYPLLYNKKISSKVFSKEDYKCLSEIEEYSFFKALDDRELLRYQNNFLRKFGNSILNPIFTPESIGISENNLDGLEKYRTNSFYIEQSKGWFQLKDEFKDKGVLDMQFYQNNKFETPEIIEEFLLKEFREKYGFQENIS